jgi:transglutaminase-like putative cysteine protease/uncharacterized protein YigE (DUF2233 family)
MVDDELGWLERTRIRTLAAVAVLFGATVRTQVAAAQFDARRPVAAGLALCTARTIDRAGRPQAVALLEVDPHADGARLEFAAAGSLLRTSDLARRGGAAAAINGGFFAKDGRPEGLLRIDGRDLGAPAPGRRTALVLDEPGRPRIAVDATGHFQGVRTARAAGPALVLGGALPEPRSWNDARHPRSAVGVTAAGRVLLLAVDGRAEQAAGMTLEELAVTMQGLGCRDALNLDGGGSTTLWVAGETDRGITNHPCDDKKFDAGGERAVADAVLVFAAPAGAEPRPDAAELERRIRHDHPWTEADLLQQLQRRVRGFARADFDDWARAGLFDARAFGDGVRYPRAAVSNLFFRDAGARQRRLQGKTWVPPSLDTEQHTFRITMRLEVEAGAVPAGETVRAWIPWPQADEHQRLLDDDAAVAEAPMRARYVERQAVAGKPTVFEVRHAYERAGVRTADLDPARAAFPASKAFTEERPPHVVFSPAIRALAREIAGDERNPLRLARRCYDWCADHLGYSFAREYSTMPCIPAEVLASRRGDCGMVTLLYMTLCRSLGIPARWQSGWVLVPGQENMHDWCEVRIEPWGWIPVDVNTAVELRHADGKDPAERARIREFFFGNLDAFRLVVNRDHAQPLVPPKQSPRSDDVDFQRGEVEWGTPARNVYFDAFDTTLRVEVDPK